MKQGAGRCGSRTSCEASHRCMWPTRYRSNVRESSEEVKPKLRGTVPRGVMMSCCGWYGIDTVAPSVLIIITGYPRVLVVPRCLSCSII